MKIKCCEFEEGGLIPARYTQHGWNLSPPLSVEDFPAGTQSLVVMLEDISGSRGPFTHWLVYNVEPQAASWRENETPSQARLGQNDAGEMGYTGPKPAIGERTYRFRVFALDQRLCKPAGAIREEVEQAMAGHVLGEAELVARCAAPAREAAATPALVPARAILRPAFGF